MKRLRQFIARFMGRANEVQAKQVREAEEAQTLRLIAQAVVDGANASAMPVHATKNQSRAFIVPGAEWIYGLN